MSTKNGVIALMALLLMLGASRAALAQNTGGVAASPMATPEGPATSGPIPLQSVPVSPQAAPDSSVPIHAANQFEHTGSISTLPNVFAHQWSTTREIPPESLISQSYIRTAETTARKMTLKEAIYIALRNNPSIKSVELTPLASLEAVRQANGAFDPNLTSQMDVTKSVVPVTSIFQTGGPVAYSQKMYDWNFGVNKLLSSTNGTLGVVFNNNRMYTNSLFQQMNPGYTPSLAVSLSQPLLQNFGWQFATISVRIAESGQKQAQWNYAQSLMDFVQRVGGDYWNVVLSEENLEVARAALKFNQDLVRQNAISVKVGTLAPLDLQEAQSAEATAEANVYTAEANLRTARAQLRQDVMYNPQETFLPAEIEPADKPKSHEPVVVNETGALETAVMYRPSLAGMREAIRGALLQVRFSENQTLPQLNLGAQIGVTAVAGTAECLPDIFKSTVPANCAVPGLGPKSGFRLPFGGVYSDALNRMWNFSYYSYAAVLGFQMPLNNATAKAALAQARIQYEQQRMNYRAALSQTVVEVENALANVIADQKRAQATEQATFFSRQALHDEQVRFRVGMATTHDLLQFQEEEVSAEGNQVQAAVDLENAKLNLQHAQGTLLHAFNIEFHLQNPHETPWYAKF